MDERRMEVFESQITEAEEFRARVKAEHELAEKLGPLGPPVSPLEAIGIDPSLMNRMFRKMLGDDDPGESLA